MTQIYNNKISYNSCLTTTIAAQVEDLKRNESESEKREMKESKDGSFR